MTKRKGLLQRKNAYYSKGRLLGERGDFVKERFVSKDLVKPDPRNQQPPCPLTTTFSFSNRPFFTTTLSSLSSRALARDLRFSFPHDSLKSAHDGFCSSMSAIFLARVQFLIS